MKVWILDPAQLTPYYNIALCDALVKAGCQVRYIASHYLYDNNLPFTENFETDYLYFRGLNWPELVKYPRLRRLLRGVSYPVDHWRLLRQIQRTPPDLLHIQWSRLPRLDRWFVQQVHTLGVPIVHTIHDVIPNFAPDASVAPLAKVYSEVDRLILHTQANRRDFLQAYPSIDPGLIRVIPLISAPNTAVPSDATREQARVALGLPPDVPVLLFFGSVRQYKGVDILLSAFRQAVVVRPDLHLIIAGQPDTSDDNALLESAKDQQHVHVYNGYIAYEDIWQFYLAADTVLFPYRSITQSAALISAMEFGRAVIVSDVGGLPETVEGNGWVVPPEDVDALSGAILAAASDRDRLREMGECSLTLIRKKYTGAAIAEVTVKVYSEIVEMRPEGRIENG